jgi:flagellar basal body rod protein FlgG
MNVRLYQAASALGASERWQEVVSENPASASVPGFKNQALSFSADQPLQSHWIRWPSNWDDN